MSPKSSFCRARSAMELPMRQQVSSESDASPERHLPRGPSDQQADRGTCCRSAEKAPAGARLAALMPNCHAFRGHGRGSAHVSQTSLATCTKFKEARDISFADSRPCDRVITPCLSPSTPGGTGLHAPADFALTASRYVRQGAIVSWLMTSPSRAPARHGNGAHTPTERDSHCYAPIH